MVQGVSVPQIPGYTASGDGSNLLSLWSQPVGAYPEALWPRRRLNDIDSSPSGWVAVGSEQGWAANVLRRRAAAGRGLSATEPRRSY